LSFASQFFFLTAAALLLLLRLCGHNTAAAATGNKALKLRTPLGARSLYPPDVRQQRDGIGVQTRLTRASCEGETPAVIYIYIYFPQPGSRFLLMFPVIVQRAKKNVADGFGKSPCASPELLPRRTRVPNLSTIHEKKLLLNL
jgi:hypothetical protein